MTTLPAAGVNPVVPPMPQAAFRLVGTVLWPAVGLVFAPMAERLVSPKPVAPVSVAG